MPRSSPSEPALDIMEVTDLLDVERSMLGPLVTPPRRVLVVPPNQRPWSWGDEEVDEFFSDVTTTVGVTHERDAMGRWLPRRSRERPHFFGTLVFDKERDGQPEDARYIIDGQQRLTALCLLASCFQIRLREWIDVHWPTASTRREFEGLISSLDDWLHGRDDNGEPVARLELDPEYQAFFSALVLTAPTRAERTATQVTYGVDSRAGQAEHPVEARLASGLTHLQSLVDAQPVDPDPTVELSWVRAVNKTLRHAFAVVVLRIGDEQFSYSVFSWLNARGTELSEADKIKAELFDRSPSSDHARITAAWNQMVECCPQRDPQAFLRHHHTAFVGIAELKTLHRTVTLLEVVPSRHPYEVVELWAKRAKQLQEIMNPPVTSPMPSSCRRAIEAIVSELGYSLLRPLLLAASDRFAPGDWSAFTKCVRLGLHYAFRMLTVGGEQEARLERKIGEISRLLTIDHASPSQVGTVLRQANSDVTFASAFTEYRTPKAKLQFYILNEIERSLSRGGLVPAEHGQSTNNIEHILPRTLSRTRIGEWSTWRDPSDVTKGSDEQKIYRNRLGNLLLLEGHINSEVGDYDFLAKKTGAYPGRAATVSGRPRSSYKDSALRLPKRLIGSSISVWDQQAIDHRQAELARIALKIWTLHPSSL